MSSEYDPIKRRQYYLNRKELELAKNKEYREANKERLKQINKVWYYKDKQNTVKYMLKYAKARAKKKGLEFTITEEHIIIPVPASPERMKKRGFNQVEIICRYLKGRFKLSVYKDVLIRVKHTKAQHKIGRKERFENIQGSFVVKNKDKIKNKKVLLVDDICTTGATFLESSKVLYKAGVAQVRCFALSKKIKK